MVCFYTSCPKSPQQGTAVSLYWSTKKKCGFMSMCTLCVFPAFLHRQSRVETPSTIRKALQSNALLPFHNTAAPRAAVPMAMSPAILFLCQRLLAPSSSSFHRACPVGTETFGLRTFLELLWRKARASSADRGSSAETAETSVQPKGPQRCFRGNSAHHHGHQNHKKTTTKNLCRVLS